MAKHTSAVRIVEDRLDRLQKLIRQGKRIRHTTMLHAFIDALVEVRLAENNARARS